MEDNLKAAGRTVTQRTINNESSLLLQFMQNASFKSKNRDVCLKFAQKHLDKSCSYSIC